MRPCDIDIESPNIVSTRVTIEQTEIEKITLFIFFFMKNDYQVIFYKN